MREFYISKIFEGIYFINFVRDVGRIEVLKMHINWNRREYYFCIV